MQSKEGVINAGTEAWEKLSAGDKAKRERAVEERKAKLKNPNMYCSTTRLLIRNVPKDFDEAQLKAVCSKMVCALLTPPVHLRALVKHEVPSSLVNHCCALEPRPYKLPHALA